MVSFELGKEIDKEKRGTKKKVCIPTRKRTSDLRIPLYDALPLSPRESTAGEIYYEVHMTHGDSEFFFLCHAHDKTKNIFIYFFAERLLSFPISSLVTVPKQLILRWFCDLSATYREKKGENETPHTK